MFNTLKYRKQRKQAHELMRHARHLLNMRWDLMSEADRTRLSEGIEALRTVDKARDMERFEQHALSLDELVGELTPRHVMAGLRENIEVLVVAIAVAMAFRAYFFQPFKIPTGSMQPTLYGIYGVTGQGEGMFNKMPLKPLKWVVTGGWHRVIRAKASGNIRISGDPRLQRPGYIAVMIGTELHRIPTHIKDSYPFRYRGGEKFRAGDILWQGTVYAGDHVFVNRLAWNWRKPRRGDVMVFETRGVKGLPQGTHYIKRMTGLPGEAISIDPPYLVVNGERVREPEIIARIEDKARVGRIDQYLGYSLIGGYNPGDLDSKTPLLTVNDVFQLGEREYFAMGDNTSNSKDSRYWGAAPERNLVGPASVVYWPFSHRWGRIP